MANFFEMKQQRQFALDKAGRIMTAAQSANRELTREESLEVDSQMSVVQALNPQIARIERQNTLAHQLVNGKLIGAPGNLRQAHTELRLCSRRIILQTSLLG